MLAVAIGSQSQSFTPRGRSSLRSARPRFLRARPFRCGCSRHLMRCVRLSWAADAATRCSLVRRHAHVRSHASSRHICAVGCAAVSAVHEARRDVRCAVRRALLRADRSVGNCRGEPELLDGRRGLKASAGLHSRPIEHVEMRPRLGADPLGECMQGGGHRDGPALRGRDRGRPLRLPHDRGRCLLQPARPR